MIETNVDDPASHQSDIPPKLSKWADGVLGDDWPDAEPPAWVVDAARECGIDASPSERATAEAILAALKGGAS